MKTQFIPIDYDYFDFQGRNYIKIIGRNEQGKRVCIIDECDVYFWAVLKNKISQDNIKKIIQKILKIKLDVKGRSTRVEKVELHDKNFLSKPVKALKIFATNYKDLHDIASQIDMKEIEKRRGYDLGFITHYIIEKNLIPLNNYEIEGELLNNSTEFGGIDMALDVDFCIKLKSHKNLDNISERFRNSKTSSGEVGGGGGWEPKSRIIFKPKILAYDIETDEFQIGKGEILMISLVGENFKKVITWKKPKGEEDNNPMNMTSKTIRVGRDLGGHQASYVEIVEDEAELLEKFVEYVKTLSPDFLVGYFSDGFDLPYLKARAEKNRVKLSLGLDGSQPRFSKGIMLTGKINGIVHIDLLKFIRTAYSQYMQSETLSLNEVSKEFLNDTKKEFQFKHSSKITHDEWENYFEYSLHDSILTYKLFEKFWPDMFEFTRVMQEPIFDVSRNGMSANVEDYIIHNLNRFNEIPEKRPTHEEISSRRNQERFEGAFVFEPTPGIYENIAMFDFTSSYGSVIVTYNLSKSTYLEKPSKENYNIEALNKKVYFSKKPGFFPEMLKEIIMLRKKFKKELKSSKPDNETILKARSNAFKLLANASYGYQGFFGARYYCLEAAAATAAFARKSIQDAIKEIDKSGFKTIYSDTDSIVFLINKKTKSQTLEFLKNLNQKLPGIMELELEDFFKRGIWVTTRGGTTGAKKKYALINEKGKVKIRGFETVRRDWCNLARETQNKVLRMILEEGSYKESLKYVKEIAKKLRKREIDKKYLIIKTQLKRPIDEYKANTPHILIAKKMLKKEMPVSMGTLIEYFITESKNKKALVRERAMLPTEPGEYDIQYYLEHQIIPSVENIFQVFDINISEELAESKQKKLEF